MQIAIFDLDGTLLDTLDDLTDAVNRALTSTTLTGAAQAEAAFPTRTRDEVRGFVGDGVEMLMRRALPTGTDEATVASALATFKAHYAAHCEDKTAPYPGVLDLLDALRACGIRVAVVSNKFDAAVKRLCARYFGDRVEIAVGERLADGIRKKPAPDTVFEALAAFGITPAAMHGHAITYIGDADTDIQTAANAGIPCISVTWGFRDRDFLTAHGATVLADTAEDVFRLLTQDCST